MAGFSKLTTVALVAAAGACFATSIAIVYVLLRKTEEDVYEGFEAIKSSRHTVIEVPIPSNVIGGVIGRNGSNVAKIQEATNTKISFRDEAKGSANRVAVIRGKPNDAQAAERLVRLAVAERMSITSEDIQVPVRACGFIIGKNGQNVRMIREVSKAKINIDSAGTDGELKTVTITGTHEEIEHAKVLIAEDVAKAMTSRKCGAPELSTANRAIQFHGRQLCVTQKPENEVTSQDQRPRVEDLVATAADGFLEVFVSFIESPNRFFVQSAISTKAAELDKLVEEMTDFYSDEANAADYCVTDIKVSDLLAAPFTCDPSWYRVEVVSVEEEDEYDAGDTVVRVFYVDFGDSSTLKKSELRVLRNGFDKLPFQVSECELSGVRPVGGGDTWTKEAVSAFGDVTRCAHWIRIMMKTLRHVPEGPRTVQLVNCNGDTDVDVAKELVARGFAELDQSAAEV